MFGTCDVAGFVMVVLAHLLRFASRKQRMHLNYTCNNSVGGSRL